METNNFLLLLMELPASSSNLRVKLWRRLQKIGAIGLKGSVYVLPDSSEHLEHFSWIAQEVKNAGGSAEMFVGTPTGVTGVGDLEEQFRRDAARRYQTIIDECASVVHSAPDNEKSAASIKTLERLRQDFQMAQRLDFFRSPHCSVTGEAVERFAKYLQTKELGVDVLQQVPRCECNDFSGRRWITRPGIFVDRLASAWFIRRFIDQKAEIVFGLPDSEKKRNSDLIFDTEGGNFTHIGDLCTFEVLAAAFVHSTDTGLSRMAKIVHDIDLEDDKYGLAETSGIEFYLRSLKEEYADDKVFFKKGSAFLDTIYRGAAGA